MKKRGSKARKVNIWSKTKFKYGSWYRKRKKTTVFLSLLVAAALTYGLLIGLEWAQFKIAERKVNDLYRQTTTTLPLSELQSIGGNCDHASAKFSKGQLNCYYESQVVYKYTKQEEIKDTINSYNEIIEKKGGILQKSIDSLLGEGEIDIFYTFNTSIGVDCTASMYTTDEPFRGVGTRKNLGRVLVLSSGCSKGPMLRPIYPMKDQL